MIAATIFEPEMTMSVDKSRGFTLLELMIVVVIIAVLAALAIFNYNKYGFRARRADGKEMISRVAAAEERWYTNTNAYTLNLTQLGFTNPAISENTFYSISAAVGLSGDTQTYVLTGAPQAGQSTDVCGSLTISNTGLKTPPPGPIPANSNGNCW